MKKLIALAVLLLAFALIANVAPANAGVYDPPNRVYTWQWQEYGPRIDELYYKILKTPQARLAAMQAGQIQVLTNPSISDVDTLFGEGNTIITAPWNAFHHIGFNMRKWPFMLDATGNAFRHATAHLVPKEEIIQAIFSFPWGNITEHWDNFLPGGQKQWLDPAIDKHPYSIDEAVNILSTAGYTFVDNTPIQGLPSSTISAGSEDYWNAPNGTRLPTVKVYTPSYADAPTTYRLVNMTVERMNTAGLANVVHEPVDFQWYLNKVFVEHDFDMYALTWTFQDPPNPSYLYSLFHSSQDYPDGKNGVGIHDSTLDSLLETIKYSIDTIAIKTAAFNAQVRLSELLPAVPIWSRNSVSIVDPELDGIVNMYGYGVYNQWTLLNAHFKGRPLGGTLNLSYSHEPVLHPMQTGATESELLDRIFDDLIVRNPETGDYMPWIATNWSIEPWIAPGDIPGMKLTFWLRNDVKWQDGVQFTAEDVRFALLYLKEKLEQERWQNIANVSIPVEDPYRVEVYYKTRNYWILDTLAKFSTRFPKHIWEGKDPYTFEPWNTPHSSVPGLTELIGTGPFYFTEYVSNDHVLLHASANYFKKLPTFTSQVVEQSGGTVQNAAGTSAVEIPPGALSESTNISIQQYPTSEYGGFLINQSENIVSYGVHQFGPSGTTFQTSVSITLTYDEILVDEEQLQPLVVYHSEDGVNWTPITIENINTDQNTITIKVDHFSLFVIIQTPATISGTVTDEYTHQPLEGLTISILETSMSTTTDNQGVYSFPDLKAGSYTVEITIPYGYLTHDAVTKFIDATGEMEVNFTVYQASWSGATIPRTIGYWKNWNNHYTTELMQALIDNVKSSSGLFGDLTVQNIDSYFDIKPRSAMREKGQAQLLTSWLNVVSAQLGADVQVDLTSIQGWETVITDDYGTLTVNDILRQIDNYYLTDATLTKTQWEIIKDILDALNSGRLFIT